MVVRDWLSSMLNDLMNCKKAGKKETAIMPVSNLMLAVLKILKNNDYIEDYKIEEDRFKIVLIKIKKINKCGAIKPRFFVKKNEFIKYIKRYLPARGFGIIIVSTNKGLMTHSEAMEQKIGGSLIAYC